VMEPVRLKRPLNIPPKWRAEEKPVLMDWIRLARIRHRCCRKNRLYYTRIWNTRDGRRRRDASWIHYSIQWKWRRR
jgi:hypothetical protein